ncbi:clumping factor A-like [Octopus bimaculoides]|nr:clumping factor A-like [Octopus bimaculoides]
MYKFLSVTTPHPPSVINSDITSTVPPKIFPSSTHTPVTSSYSTPIQSSYKLFSFSPKTFLDSSSTTLAAPRLTSALSSSLLHSSVLNHRTSGVSPHITFTPEGSLNTNTTLNIDDYSASVTQNIASSSSRSKAYTDLRSASGDDMDTNSASGMDMDSNSASGEDMDSSSASGENLHSNYGSGYYPDTPSPSGGYAGISSLKGEKPGSNSVSDNSIKSPESNQNSTLISPTTTSASISVLNNSIPAHRNKSGSSYSVIHNPYRKPDPRKSPPSSSASSLTLVDDTDYSSASGDNLNPSSSSDDDEDDFDSNSASGDDLDSNSASGINPEDYRPGNNQKISRSAFVDEVKDSKPEREDRQKSKPFHAINSNNNLEKSVSNDVYIDIYPYAKSKPQTKHRKWKKKGWKNSFLNTQPITKYHSHVKLTVHFQPTILRKQSSDSDKGNNIQDLVPSDMYDYQDIENIPRR